MTNPQPNPPTPPAPQSPLPQSPEKSPQAPSGGSKRLRDRRNFTSTDLSHRYRIGPADLL
jgi:hypothetical protein